MLSDRFTTMYRNQGLSRPDVAKLLRVTERTLQNWESGTHEIPYSAYKLMRLLTREELPGKAWAGWHITAGTLWTPEGHGFKPLDSSWWSMLCRRAAQFHPLYEENIRLRTLLEAVRVTQAGHVAQAQRAPGPVASDAPTGEAGWAAKPTDPRFISITLQHTEAKNYGSSLGNRIMNTSFYKLVDTNQKQGCKA